MFTQSGELVTISRLKIKEKWKFLRSLRFRITVILVIIGIVPCVILEKSIVNSYEDRAVSVRSITVKNQCDIICNQLIQQNYMEDPGSDVINGQLSMLTNIYGGRILIIDQDFRVIKDTYDMDRGKTIISQEVIQSFQGKETSQYDRKNNYLEMTVRIQNTETKETLGGSIKAGNNQERTDTLTEQVAILEEYLPRQVEGDELAALIEVVLADTGASTKKDMGRVMGELTRRTGGNFDKAGAAQVLGSKLS